MVIRKFSTWRDDAKPDDVTTTGTIVVDIDPPYKYLVMNELFTPQNELYSYLTEHFKTHDTIRIQVASPNKWIIGDIPLECDTFKAELIDSLETMITHQQWLLSVVQQSRLNLNGYKK